MKNVEHQALPLELERRLRLGVAHLRETRENLEELVRIADALKPLIGSKRMQVQAKAAPRPAPKAAGARPQAKRAAAPAPPARHSQPAQGGESSAPPSPPGEVPEWRKVFPELSAKVPLRAEESAEEKVPPRTS